MKKLQPIGLAKKKNPEEKDQEQISFRLSGKQAQIKRRFAAMLAERGLDIKAVLIEFIEHYVRWDGKLGVGKLDDQEISKWIKASGTSQAMASSTAYPQTMNKALPTLTPAADENSRSDLDMIREKCHNWLDLILQHGSSKISNAIIENLDSFARLVHHEETNDGGSETHASEALSPEVQSVHQRAQNAIRRSRATRTRKRGSDSADQKDQRSSA
jgi:hypothetical protein